MSELVVMERVYHDPISLGDVRTMTESGAWCLETNRVRHRHSYLAADGGRLTCVFDAPDAEALRRAARQLGIDAVRIWSGTLHVAVADPSAALQDRVLVLVERSFSDPVVLDELQAIEDAAAWCLDTHRVKFLHTYFSADHRRLVCVYAAPDVEAVRETQSTAAMPFDRVWAADVFARGS
jgi:hypothetical protein